jgi:purine-binding chemotaxis protein CheW
MNLAEIRRKAQAAAAQPAAEQVRQAQPVTLQVVAAQATSAQPDPEQVLATQLAAAAVPAAQPAAVQLVAVQPATDQPATDQSVAVQSVADSLLPAQTAAAQPVAAEPARVQPAPVQPAPVQPAQSQLQPELPQWQPPSDWQPPVAPALPEPPQLLREPILPRVEPELQEQDLASLPEWEEPSGFDPASVILKGRQSAAGPGQAREADLAEASLELLCFRVATEDYAISIMDIKEIIKPREVTEVPRVPAFVRGILSLRGIIIPVFDMRLRLGLPEGVHSERERIIVVKRQGGFCGVLVDQVVQVVRIAEAKLEAPPVVLEGIDREFIQGIGRVAGRMLILLDMEKVLDIGLL